MAPILSEQEARAKLSDLVHHRKPDQRETPVDPQLCEGEITVTDPRHPLYGKSLKLTGFAFLRGHIRHCQVEIHSGRVDHVTLASTNLSTEPRPEGTQMWQGASNHLPEVARR